MTTRTRRWAAEQSLRNAIRIRETALAALGESVLELLRREPNAIADEDVLAKVEDCRRKGVPVKDAVRSIDRADRSGE